MENNLFDDVELFEQVPTALLKEVTAAPPATPTINLDSLTSHTDSPPINFAPVGATAQPNIPPATPQNNMNVGSIVSAEMAAQLFNIVLPAVMVILIQKATNKKVIKQQFEATNKEIEVIKPVLQNYLNSINFTVESPLNALVLTVAVIYGSKAIEALNGEAKGTIKTADFKPPVMAEKTQQTGTRKPRPSGMKYNKTK